MTALSLPPEVFVLGVASGVGYGLLGTGLVLTFRASRVLNLAHGQVGAFAAVVLLEVVNAGASYWVGLFAAIATAVALGAALELAVIRRVAKAPPVIAMVATLGVAQVLLLGAQELGRSATARELYPQPPGLPSFDVGALTVVPANVALLVLGPLVVLALTLLLGRTGVGIAMRAAATNPQGARALGIPAGRMATVAWAVAAALAALTAVLVIPATAGFPTAEALGPSLLLRALAASVIGRFWSLPWTLAAGVGLGLVEQVVLWNTNEPALLSPILLGVVFVAMLVLRPVQGRLADPGSWAMVASLPRLPESILRRPGVRITRVALALALLAGAALAPLAFEAPTLVGVACMGIAGISAWMVIALGGQLSLGQFALAGVGATFAGKLTGSPALGFAAAAVAGATIAAVLSLPALRDRGLGFAVTSLAFAAAAPSFLGMDWALGSAAEPARLVHGATASYEVALLALVIVAVAVAALARGPAGRRLVAARDNEGAARALGIPTVGLRLRSTALAGGIAGIAGALLAQGLFAVTPDQFRVADGISVVAVAVVGGLGSPIGPLLGTVGIVGIPALAGFSSTALAAVAIGWLAILILVPGGLASAWVAVRDRLVAGLPDRSEPAVAATNAAEWDAATGASPEVLVVSGVSVTYESLRALENVSLRLDPGEAVGIVGPNGAGKSTLVDVICGALRPDTGTVELGGEDIGWMGPSERAGRGIVRSQQDGRLFPTMTPVAVVELALERGDPERLLAGLLRPASARRRRALGILRSFGLAGYADTPIGALSTGTRRFVELAAMLTSAPSILVLDEPSAGIAQAELGALAALLIQLRERTDLSLVIVEHDANLVGLVTDRLVRIDGGRLVEAPGRPPAPPARRAPARVMSPGPAALECRKLCFAYDSRPILDGVDLAVGPGELVGVLGPNGAGKSTLLRALSGMLPAGAGSVYRDGAEVTGLPAEGIARGGLSLVESGSATFDSLTVWESVTLAARGRGYHGAVRGEEALDIVGTAFPELSERGDVQTRALSTGERQLLGLAQAFVRRPDVLLIDDLGLALSAEAADRMVEGLARLRDEGAAVLLVDQSSDLVLDLVDRACWLEGGRLQFDGAPAELGARDDLLRPVFLSAQEIAT